MRVTSKIDLQAPSHVAAPELAHKNNKLVRILLDCIHSRLLTVLDSYVQEAGIERFIALAYHPAANVFR